MKALNRLLQLILLPLLLVLAVAPPDALADGLTEPTIGYADRVQGTISTQNLTPTVAATANSAVEITLNGASRLGVDVRGTYTGALNLQTTLDGVNWTTGCSATCTTTFTKFTDNTTGATIGSGATGYYTVTVGPAFKARVTALGAVTGAGAVVTLRGDPSASGSSSAAAAGGGLTDAELRATPVPVSGTVAVTGVSTAANQATQITAEQAIQVSAASIDTKTPTASTTANVTATRWPVSLPIADPVTGTAASAAILSNMPFAVGKGTGGVIVNVTANTATANFEWSTDGVVAMVAHHCWIYSANTTSGPVTSTTTASTYVCPVRGTHFQVRQSGAGGVTATVAPVSAAVMLAIQAYVGTGFVGGLVAEDAAASGANPFITGLEARNTAKGVMSATGDLVRAQATMNGVQIVLPGAIPELTLSYAAASGGISNTTTAVTMFSALASNRNYIRKCQLSSDALGAASELAIRDGAAGTVLYRMKIGTAGILSYDIGFDPPLRGSVNTLTEVVTLTASVTGGVFINCQGYTAP